MGYASVAIEYVNAGYAVTPLHDVAGGACSCGNAEPEHNRKQGGKHPRLAAWQRNPFRDVATVTAYWNAHPTANIGIATGALSGIWVLDIDPDNGGDQKLAGLVTQYGTIPPTRTVRTGSGGTHYYFRTPPDFRPTNSRGRLPVGIDVRGDGGQVVAPPSVSSKGGYALVCAAAVADAPAWLLDLIRPPAYDLSAIAHMDAAAGIGTVQASDLDTMRGRAYARTALNAVVDELSRTVLGGRNDAAFRSACRLIELCNAGWLPIDDALASYHTACQMMSDAAPGAPFSQQEAASVWNKAAVKVGSTTALLPRNTMGGDVMGYVDPVAYAQPAPAMGSQSLSGGLTTIAGAPTFSFTDVGTAPIAPSVLQNAPSLPAGVAGGPQTELQARVAALMSAMLDADQLASQPPPAPLVDGLLSMDSSAWMIGAPGSGKSFVALDLATHIATGRQYRGQWTRGGRVIYIVAEGAGGMGQRVNAWRKANGGAPMGDIIFLPLPVQAGDPIEWAALVECCRQLAPALVVVDTQSRCTSGINENDNTDMMRYVHAVDALRASTGACVLTIHHTGRNGTHARGASAIDGAQDTELRLERVEGEERRIRLTTSKQKDGRDDIEHELLLDVVELGASPHTGLQITSLAVRPLSATPVRDVANDGGVDEMCRLAIRGARSCTEAMAALVKTAYAHGNGGTAPQVKTSLAEFRKYSKTSMNSAWSDLVEKRVIARIRGTQNWRYVPMELRNDLIEPIHNGSATGGFYAPDAPSGS